MMKKLYSLIIFACFLASCQSNEKLESNPLDRLPDNQAGEVVKKAIDFAGGWDNWERRNNFSFYKKITQVDSLGAVVKSIKQLHRYNLGNQFQARMTWSIDSVDYVIINDGDVAKKYKGETELTDDKSKKEAWNSSYGSHYVISMPYKLTDPGVTLTYEGVDNSLFDKAVHSVKVEYAKDAGSSGGMHTWWYYFDKENYDLVANFLDYGNGHSLTTYEVFEDVDGMRFHNRRFSYQSNENKEKVVLKTIYENEEMKFDQAFDSDAFKLK